MPKTCPLLSLKIRNFMRKVLFFDISEKPMSITVYFLTRNQTYIRAYYYSGTSSVSASCAVVQFTKCAAIIQKKKAVNNIQYFLHLDIIVISDAMDGRIFCILINKPDQSILQTADWMCYSKFL